jgi:hypothetical protein
MLTVLQKGMLCVVVELFGSLGKMHNSSKLVTKSVRSASFCLHHQGDGAVRRNLAHRDPSTSYIRKTLPLPFCAL